LALYIRATKELGCCNNRHSCFAGRALLKHPKSLNPISPWFFGNPIFSQLIQWILDIFAWFPHQKFCIIPFSSLRSVAGRRNTLILYVGIACKTTFNRIMFLAWDKNLIFQLFSWFQTPFLIFWNAVIDQQ